MLDEFGTELESTESRLDTTMKKMAKVLRISNGEYLIIYRTNALKDLVISFLLHSSVTVLHINLTGQRKSMKIH